MALMRGPDLDPIRKSAASTLRAWADQLAPRVATRPRPGAAPLVRLGGRWWPRDKLTGPRDEAEV
jgi:hypothetical protein